MYFNGNVRPSHHNRADHDAPNGGRPPSPEPDDRTACSLTHTDIGI
jgi:hypothetical protein